MKAGFAEIDITPKVPSNKIGWLMNVVGERVLDPLSARIAVFETEKERIAFIQLDTLSVRWTQTNDIRHRISERFDFPRENIMVSATHNHASPAVANVGMVARNESYIEGMVEKCVVAFGEALRNSRPAKIAFAKDFEFEVANNRRIRMRDGVVKTHHHFNDPNSLCQEGTIDPELAVLAVKDAENGENLGCLFNFTCHPTHHGGDDTFSAGFPGEVTRKMREQGWPVTLYLNGAYGDVHHSNPTTNKDKGINEIAEILTNRATKALDGVNYGETEILRMNSATIDAPYRLVTDAEVAGIVKGAQRFIDPKIYDDLMPALLKRIKERKTQPVEIQSLRIGDLSFVGIPAEYFVAHGLRIKEETHPAKTLIVGGANGMIGYVPTIEAFKRGGYETTFGGGSRMAPETGDLLADQAIALISEMFKDC